MSRSSPQLAALLGLDKSTIEETLRVQTLEAAEIVAEEFRRVLTQLQQDSQSGAFDGYTVVIDIEPYSITTKALGTVKAPRCHIYVQSPDHAPGGINLFDLLDAGRPALPVRSGGQSPYPMWNIGGVDNPILVARPHERRRRKGRFSISSPKSGFRGKRPEKLRYTLMGPKPANSQYSPALFTRGPIKAVPPDNLYKRIYENAKKKLRAQGFTLYELILAQRKSD
jgi:hypothetical protein